jgi:hypothetical protein
VKVSADISVVHQFSKSPTSTGEAMSYPPGSPGYPPAQQPTTQFSAPTQQFGKVPDASGAGAADADAPSKLPSYLLLAVAALGVLAFLLNIFAPVFALNLPTEYQGIPGLADDSGTSQGMTLAVAAALLAGLLAGVSSLPRQRNLSGIVAAIALLGFLMVLANVFQKPNGLEYGWGVWLILVFTLLQTAAAIAAVLFDSGVITPPAPKPKFDQPQYGQYGGPGGPGGYYGQQPAGQPQQFQQRPGQYPSQQYGGYPGQPSTGGFGGPQGGPAAGQNGPQNGPPTPPTGFPTYGQPQQPANPSQAPSSQQSGSSPS